MVTILRCSLAFVRRLASDRKPLKGFQSLQDPSQPMIGNPSEPKPAYDLETLRTQANL